jgi:hypothetical protein
MKRGPDPFPSLPNEPPAHLAVEMGRPRALLSLARLLGREAARAAFGSLASFRGDATLPTAGPATSDNSV